MKRVLKISAWTIGGLVTLFLIAFIFLWATEWRPKSVEQVYAIDATNLFRLKSDTITVLTWNTGYAGFGFDMDYYMYGGQQTRTSRKNAAENLDAITRFLTECDADVILLQEVDVHSRRSYGVNQMNVYRDALKGYTGFFAYNYASRYVPFPLRAPMGEVQSGTAIFTKLPAVEVLRFQYPGIPAFPRNLFDQKRGLLTARFITQTGHNLWIGNTHNTDYNEPDIRFQEVSWINGWFRERYNDGTTHTIVGGTWNQTPPNYIPSTAEIDDTHFRITPVSSILSDGDWMLSYDTDPLDFTARYLDKPVHELSTVTTIDYFFMSPQVECIDVQAIYLGFENSDHNPVIATFVLKN